MITREDLLNLGFEDGGGSLLRKFYRDFVIDILPTAFDTCYRMELRGGILGNGIPGKIETMEELKVLLTIFDRAT